MLAETQPVRNFADHLATGLETADGTKSYLTLLTEATEKSPVQLQDALKAVIPAVEQGYSLSTALSSHPDVFDARFVGVVRQGEKTGLLDETLRKFANEDLEAA